MHEPQQQKHTHYLIQPHSHHLLFLSFFLLSSPYPFSGTPFSLIIPTTITMASSLVFSISVRFCLFFSFFLLYDEFYFMVIYILLYDIVFLVD